MEYTYQQVQELIQLSRTSFFTRLNLLKPEIEKYIVKRDGINYISQEGFEMLRDYKKSNNEKISQQERELQELQQKIKKMAEESSAINEKLKEKTQQQEILERQLAEQSQNIFFFQEQLREKDNQIQKLSNLVENGQILLKQEQEQCKLLAESVQVQESGDDIVQISHPSKKKGILGRIFKR